MGYGPYNTLKLTVDPGLNPVASFIAPPNYCSGTAIPFTSTVTGGASPYKYLWEFDDGSTSTASNPSHAFTVVGCGDGSVANKLTVTDAKGCTGSYGPISTSIHKAPDVKLADQDVFYPFSNCHNNPTPANPNYTLTVNNISPSASCINNYNLDWGDGFIQNGLTGASFPLTHTYMQLGAFSLVITGIGSNCSYSKTYIIANQSNPAGSLGTLGSTTGLCAPVTIPFTIDNWKLNSPGTIYILNFGDGDSVTLTHPLNAGLTTDTVYHEYTSTSCPNPSFTANLNVVNACTITPYSAGNIQIQIKPSASFSVSPDPGCTGKNVCFSNTTKAGFYGTSCSTATVYSWDFGDGSALDANESPCHIYNKAGTYTIVLTASNPCGSTTYSKQICITDPPTVSFLLDKLSGCIGLEVNATNNTGPTITCASYTYDWSVSYAAANCGTTSSWSFTKGTDASSTNPSFIFNNSGTYAIKLSVTSPCGTYTSTQNISVKKPPEIKLNAVPDACGAVNIHPLPTVTQCGTDVPTYLWTFEGGTPSSST